jgi:hypothetical protein
MLLKGFRRKKSLDCMITSGRIVLLIDKVNSPTKRIIVPSSLKLLLPKVCGFGIVILAY